MTSRGQKRWHLVDTFGDISWTLLSTRSPLFGCPRNTIPHGVHGIVGILFITSSQLWQNRLRQILVEAPSHFPPYFWDVTMRLVFTPLSHVLLQVDQLEYVQSTKMQRSLLNFKASSQQLQMDLGKVGN